MLRDERDKKDRDPWEWSTAADRPFAKYLVFEGCRIQKYIERKKSSPPTNFQMEFEDLLINPFAWRSTSPFLIEVLNEAEEDPGDPGRYIYRRLIMRGEASVPYTEFAKGEATKSGAWTASLKTV